MGVADKPKALQYWLGANLTKVVELYIKVSFIVYKKTLQAFTVVSFEGPNSEAVSLR